MVSRFASGTIDKIINVEIEEIYEQFGNNNNIVNIWNFSK